MREVTVYFQGAKGSASRPAAAAIVSLRFREISCEASLVVARA